MISLNLVKREVTYLLVALTSYQRDLRARIGDEMGDEYDDLLVVEHLIKRISDAEESAGSPAVG